VAQPPRGPRALLAEADRLRERGQAARAVGLYGKLVDADPENVEALTGRGLCYLDLGQWSPAVASFQAALAVEPGRAEALMGLAESYRAQGQPAEALRQYQRYLALHPQGEEADVARNAIARLKE
jgi:tetratricopeptide (TPR) repeat protein